MAVVPRLADISVVIPMFNAAATIAAAITSALSQSHTNLEVVVVDDGSTDRSAEIVAAFCARDARVRLVSHSTNRGLVAALNTGIGACRSDLVARLDADDVAQPQRLAAQRAHFDNSAVVLSASGYRRVDSSGTEISRHAAPRDHATFVAALATGNCICHSSVMFRRSTVLRIGGYRREWFPVEDYDLWIRLSRVGAYRGLDDIGVDYLVSGFGISADSAGLQQDMARRRQAEYIESIIGDHLSPSARSRLTGDTVGQGPDHSQALRALNQLAREMRRELADSGHQWRGADRVLRSHALSLLADKRRLSRHVALARQSPGLALRGIVAGRR